MLNARVSAICRMLSVFLVILEDGEFRIFLVSYKANDRDNALAPRKMCAFAPRNLAS